MFEHREPIRERSFRRWFKTKLKRHAKDIANHGADAGYPYLTYNFECAYIFDHFADEIWEMAVEDAENLGNKNVAEMLAGFNRADMMGDWYGFRTLMLWYAAEKVAREMEDKRESRRR